MKYKNVWAVGLASLFTAGLAGCGTSPTSSGGTNKITITYWAWGESDIPGYNNWLAKEVKAYEKQHPNVTVKVVTQSTSTLTGAFQSAAATHSGPDIATLWATIPVLSQVWSGYVSPISNYVSKNQLSQWLNTSENTYQGKVWGMPVYLIGVPLVYNKTLFAKAGLNPNKPPKTWSQFLHDSAVLKAHGITPLGMGNSDGYTGAWLFSVLGLQNLNSISQLQQAVVGKQNIQSPQFTGWYNKFNTLIKDGYFNSNISSLSLQQGWQLFPQGKVAMSWTTDGNAIHWLKTMGGDSKVGFMKTPVWGHGKLAQAYDSTQSSTAFITSWSPHKRQDAKFLAFLHSQSAMTNWWHITHAFPADKQFNTSLIKDPAIKQLWNWDTTGQQVWPENYLPPMVDQNADLAGGQMITSQSGSPAKVASLWRSTLSQWKSQNPSQYHNYLKWASSSSR